MLDVLEAEPDYIALKGDIARQIEPDYLWNAKIFTFIHLFLRLVVLWLLVSLLCLFLSYLLCCLLQLLDLFQHTLLFRLVDSQLLLFLHQLTLRPVDSCLDLQILESNDHNEYEDE